MSVPTTPATGRANVRIVAIDVVRGLAILWVILYHLWTDVNSFHVGTVSSRFHAVPDAIADRDPVGTAEAIFHAVLRVGYLGVPLFMILSGLSLTLAAHRREFDLRSAPGFLRRRFRRVLVPYWFGWAYTVVCFALIALWQVIQFGRFGFWHYWWEGTFTIPHRAAEVVSNPLAAGNSWAGLLLVPRILRDQWQFAPEGSLWFVLLIVQYYLLFPFLLVALRRVGAALFLTATLVVTLVSLNLILAIDGNLSRLHRVLDMGAPFRLFEFGLGMTAGYLLASRPGLVQRAARCRGAPVRGRRRRAGRHREHHAHRHTRVVGHARAADGGARAVVAVPPPRVQAARPPRTRSSRARRGVGGSDLLRGAHRQ